MKNKKPKTIEDILDNYLVEYVEYNNGKPKYTKNRTKKKLSEEIKQLIADEVIGEDETPLIKSEYPELGKLKIDTTEFNEAIVRNKLRKEQRKKLERL